MKRTYLLSILLLTLLWSCEEEVVLDLKNIEKQLVVEAYVSNSNPLAEVALSYSQGFYDEPVVDLLTNASVSITSSNGETEQLVLNSQNKYVSKLLKADYGNTYSLKIEVDDKLVEVETKIPSKIEIGKVLFVPNPFYGSPDSLNTIVNVPDEVGVDNYFRLKVNHIGKESVGIYYVLDDALGKDGIISMPVYFNTFTWGDTAVIELQHLNRDIYDYYIGLSDNLGGSFNSIAPGNPETNMPDDVLGFIAGMSIDIDTLVINPSL